MYSKNLENVSYHFYVDDIQLYCSFKDAEFHKLTNLLACLSGIKNWLNNNYLRLNKKKKKKD